jgi:hydrogenase nickel incorporation protein HypA/HybF
VHELSIASAIVATAERHADGKRVTTVHVRVGRLRQVVPDSLQFCFGMVARESVCEGAVLELEIIPAVLRCTACANEWEIEEPPFWCPSCAGGDVTPVRGEELEVESIEIEDNEKEPACIAPT